MISYIEQYHFRILLRDAHDTSVYLIHRKRHFSTQIFLKWVESKWGIEGIFEKDLKSKDKCILNMSRKSCEAFLKLGCFYDF